MMDKVKSLGIPFFRSKPLRIGTEFPKLDKNYQTTPYYIDGKKSEGVDFNFHSHINGKWAVLFSHPCDYTPVCTTEIASFAKKQNEFDKRNVRLVGLSIGDIDNHKKWKDEIESKLLKTCWIEFPIIAADKALAEKLDMLDKVPTPTNERTAGCPEDWHTIRSVFIINPLKEIRAILSYPMETGRNIDEIIRMIDSLQAHFDQGRAIVSPANWQPGDPFLFKITDLKKLKELFSDVIPGELWYMNYKHVAKSQLPGFRQESSRDSATELGVETPTRPV